MAQRWYDGSLFEEQNVLPAATIGSSIRMQAFSLATLTSKTRLDQPGKQGTYIHKPTPADIQSDEYYQSAQTLLEHNQLPNHAHDHTVCLFGRTAREDGAQSVCLRVKFPVSFVVEMPTTHESAEDTRALINSIRTTIAEKREWHNSKSDVRKHKPTALDMVCRADRKTRAVTWVPDPHDKTKARQFSIIKMSFRNEQDCRDIQHLLKSPIDIGGNRQIVVSVWETKDYYSAQMRFAIETGIDPGNWLVANNVRRLVWTTASTDLEFEVAVADLVPDHEDQTLCPTTRACIDIECINGDRSERLKMKNSALDKFPNPSVLSHKIIMIGASFFMADGRELRYLLQLDHEESDEQARNGLNRYPARETDATRRLERRVYVDERFEAKTKAPYTVDMAYRADYFSDEREMICALRDLIVYYDADMLVSFNGDKFDWPYLVGRMGVLEEQRLQAESRGNYDDDVRVERFNQLGRFVFDRWDRGRSKLGEYIPLPELALEKGTVMTPHLPGRIGLDLRALVVSLQANPKYRFASTTLDNVAERFLGDKKLDMGHNAIFDSWFGWREDKDGQLVGTGDQQRQTLGDYCVKDVELPIRIIDNQFFIMYLWQMGRITHTPPHNIVNNGQMMRVTAQFCHEANKQNRFVNKNFIPPYSFTGACVLTPSVGFWGGVDLADNPAPTEPLKKPAELQPYLDKLTAEETAEYQSDDVVLTLDYKSLYPSIMRSHCFCPSTLYSPDRVLSPAEKFAQDYHAMLARRDNIVKSTAAAAAVAAAVPYTPIADEDILMDDDSDGDEAEYHQDDPSGVVFDAPDRDDFTTIRVHDPKQNVDRYHKFTKHDQGIYTVLLKRLMDERVVYKDKGKLEMKKGPEYDHNLVAIYDGRQLALKVSANSIYGVTGAKQDTPCACCPLAECVTAVGRQMIGRTKHVSEVTFGKYKTRVIYGDSVAANTPILVRERATNQVRICRIDELVEADHDWQVHHGDKGAVAILGLDVLDEHGWTPLRRVIRHPTTKAMMVVHTNDGGEVTCTADHSLLRYDGTEVSPRDLVVEDALLHLPAFPPECAVAADKTLQLEATTSKCYALAAFIRTLGGKATETPPTVSRSVALANVAVDNVVYDLETDSQHFHAGTGNLVLHNTDSVMVWMKQSSDVVGWKVAAEIAEYVTEVVFGAEENVNELEAEKITRGYSLFSKKCYVGAENEGLGKPYKDGQKGISTVRLDKPGVLNTLQKQLITVAAKCYQMQRRTVAKLMVMICLDHFEDMVAGRTPLQDYVISQRINKRTKETSHVFLANKLEAATGMTVSRGDAVRYVHIRNPNEPLASHRVETPDILIKQDWNKMVDKEYYLTNKIHDQIKKTLRLYVPPECIEDMFTRYQAALGTNGQQNIEMFFTLDQTAEQLRRQGIMNTLESACKRKRMPVRDNIPEPVSKRRKVMSKADKQATASKNRSRLDEFFK